MSSQPSGGDSTGNATDSIVLEEEIDPNYVPSESEVFEYAKWLGMDLDKDVDLFWVAREGLMAPLPKNWKPCKTKDTEDIYYFNFATGESTWDHPCDGYYKRLYEEEKKKKEIQNKESNDQKRSRAKQDVDQLLGKGEKKKKKEKSTLDSVETIGKRASSAPPLDRKPLPGIQAKMKPLESGLTLQTDMHPLQSSRSRDENSEPKSKLLSKMKKVSHSIDEVSEFKSQDFEDSSDENAKRTSITSLASRTSESMDSDRDVRKFENDLAKQLQRKQEEHDDIMARRKREWNSERMILEEEIAKQRVKLKLERDTVEDELDAATKSKASKASVDSNVTNLLLKAEKDINDLRLKLREAETDLEQATRKCDRLQEAQADNVRKLAREREHSESQQLEFRETEALLQKRIKNLQEKLDSARDEEARLIDDNKYLKRVASGETSSSSSTEIKDIDLSAKIQTLNEQIKTKDVTIIEMETQVAQYRQQVSQFEISTKHHLEDIARLNQDLQKANSESKQAREELDILSSTRDRLLKRSKALEEELATLEVSSIKWKRDMDEKVAAIDSKQLEIRTLNARLKEYEDQSLLNKTVVTDVSSSKEKYDALLLQMNLLQTEQLDANTMYEIKRKECEQLQQNVNSLQKECDDKEKRLQQFKERATEWQDRFLSVEAELLLTRSTKPVEDNNSTIARELQTAKDELEKKQSQLWQLENTMNIERSTNSTNEKLLSECRGEIIGLQRQLIQVGSKVALTTTVANCSSCDVMRAQIEELKSRKSDFIANDKDDTLATIKLIEGEKLVLQTQNNALNDRVHGLTAEVSKLQADLLHKELLLKEVASAHQNLLGDVSQLKASVEYKISEIRTLNNTIDFERTERSNVSNELEYCRKQIVQLTSDLQAMRAHGYTHTENRVDLDAGKFQGPLTMTGLVELGIMMGQQQTTVQRLEEKLQSTEAIIQSLSERKQREEQENVSPNVLPIKGKRTEAMKDPLLVTSLIEDKEDVDTTDADDYSQLLKNVLIGLSKKGSKVPVYDENHRMNSNMMERVQKERKFIEDAKALLREERSTMRVEQDRLNQRKDSWKERKKSVHADDTAGKLALKGAIKQLNERTSWLNNTVAQIKRTHDWILSRSKKLDAIELYILNLASPDSVRDADLIALRQLWKELETDLSALGSDSHDIDEDSLVHNIVRMIKSDHHDHHDQQYHQYNHFSSSKQYAGSSSTSSYPTSSKDGAVTNAKWAMPSRMHNRNWDMPSSSMMEQGLVQSQLKRFAEQRAQSTEAYEVHARWLDNLQQEITRYTSSQSIGRGANNTNNNTNNKNYESINIFNI